MLRPINNKVTNCFGGYGGYGYGYAGIVRKRMMNERIPTSVSVPSSYATCSSSTNYSSSLSNNNNNVKKDLLFFISHRNSNNNHLKTSSSVSWFQQQQLPFQQNQQQQQQQQRRYNNYHHSDYIHNNNVHQHHYYLNRQEQQQKQKQPPFLRVHNSSLQKNYSSVSMYHHDHYPSLSFIQHTQYRTLEYLIDPKAMSSRARQKKMDDLHSSRNKRSNNMKRSSKKKGSKGGGKGDRLHNPANRFVDRVRIKVQGGPGGNGSLSTNQVLSKKKMAKLKPDGGHGGDGGCVILIADHKNQATNSHSSATLRTSKSHYVADQGTHGGNQMKHGRNGKNLIIPVPVGVIVRRILNHDEIWDPIHQQVITKQLDDDDYNNNNPEVGSDNNNNNKSTNASKSSSKTAKQKEDLEYAVWHDKDNDDDGSNSDSDTDDEDDVPLTKEEWAFIRMAQKQLDQHKEEQERLSSGKKNSIIQDDTQTSMEFNVVVNQKSKNQQQQQLLQIDSVGADNEKTNEKENGEVLQKVPNDKGEETDDDDEEVYSDDSDDSEDSDDSDEDTDVDDDEEDEEEVDVPKSRKRKKSEKPKRETYKWEKLDDDDDYNGRGWNDKDDWDLAAPIRKRPPRTKVFLADLDKPGAYVVVARGGKGGLGVMSYASRNGPLPDAAIIVQRSQPIAAETVHLELELKSIADIGLVGYPNAGKSSLLRSMSAAQPEVAPYPFTTLHPIIGCIEYKDGYRIRVADIPGLVDGASQGKGKGFEFLKHIERTKVLLYIVDGVGVDENRDPINDLYSLAHELDSYNNGTTTGGGENNDGGTLLYRDAIIVANKIDLLGSQQRIDDVLGKLTEAATSIGLQFNGTTYGISAGVTGSGLRELSKELRVVTTNTMNDLELRNEQEYD